MQFLNPGFLGSQEHFRREYVLPIERFSDPEATNNLRKLVAPFILRRLKSDPNVISDLPDKMEMKEYCLLTEEQATLYQAAVQNSLQEIENKSGLERRGNVLALLTRLKQICNHPIQYLHQVEAATPSQIAGRSGKLTRLIEMLEEVLAEGDRSLIFTQYAEMGKLLTAYLPHALRHSVLFLHGETPAKSRDQMVYRFQEEEHGPQIFILSLKAGGYGLNLTRANHVFHFDRWWNPAVEDQATDRTYRIGQHQNVLVHKFIITGSLEERIDELIESKKGLSDSIIGGGEQWLTELSTDELRELVALRT
jgi:SNF2 family DNA or RNA helicase